MTKIDVPGTREAWEQARVGCYWSHGPYSICTVSGPYGSGYRLTCNREEIPGPPFTNALWNTFEAAAAAAGRHAVGKR